MVLVVHKILEFKKFKEPLCTELLNLLKVSLDAWRLNKLSIDDPVLYQGPVIHAYSCACDLLVRKVIDGASMPYNLCGIDSVTSDGGIPDIPQISLISDVLLSKHTYKYR